MLKRRYASGAGSLDSLDNDAGSIHSLEEAEAKLNHIEGSPYHFNLEPSAPPTKRPPKATGRNETYMSPQPWGLEPPNRSFREDLMDTSPVASPGRLNNELRITPRLTPETAPIFRPAARVYSNDINDVLPQRARALVDAASNARPPPDDGVGVLPQLMVTSPTGVTRARHTGEPQRCSPAAEASGPRNRRGTLPPSALPTKTAPGTGRGPTVSSSAPQLRSPANHEQLAPKNCPRRGSTGAVKPQAEVPKTQDSTRAVPTSRRASTDVALKPTPPASRRASTTAAVPSASPAVVGAAAQRRSSQNTRPSALLTAEPVPVPSETPVEGDSDELFAAVQRFNGKLGVRGTPTAPVQATPVPTRQTVPPARRPARVNGKRTACAPAQTTQALPPGDESFLFEGDLRGTMSAPYYGVDMSASDKKLQPQGSDVVVNGSPGSPRADALECTQLPEPAEESSQRPPRATDTRPRLNDNKAGRRAGQSPSSSTTPPLRDGLKSTQRPPLASQKRQTVPPNGTRRPATESVTVDDQSAEVWTAVPVQMSVNQGHSRRSARRLSLPQAAVNSAPATGSGAAPPQTVVEPQRPTKRCSVPPPAVTLPPSTEHKPCEKAKNAKRLPPPVAATRKSSPRQQANSQRS